MNLRKILLGIWYSFMKNLVNLALNLYYKDIQLYGLEKIPFGKPMFFISNHQNTFIDPLLMVSMMPLNPSFLTRSDVFKSKIARSIFYSFKMLPIYRQRDGGNTVEKNEPIFKECIRRLSQNETVVIFPEGNHGGQRRLRPLKKGLARICHMAAEQTDYQLDLYIVPIGLNYSVHENFRSKVLINVGEPIHVKGDYFAGFHTDLSRTITELKVKMRERLRPLMHHIQSVDMHDWIEEGRKLYGADMAQKMGLDAKDLYEQLQADKFFIAAMEDFVREETDKIPALSQELMDYSSALKAHKFRDHTLKDGAYQFHDLLLESLAWLLCLPVFLYGAITNYLPYAIPQWTAKKMFKDRLFHSPIKMLLGIFLYPLQYLIWGILFYFLLGGGSLLVCFIASLPLSGHIAIRFAEWTKKWNARWRYFHKSRRKKPSFMKLMDQRKSLFDRLDQITKQKLAIKAQAKEVEESLS